jgi:hypothetical protein
MAKALDHLMRKVLAGEAENSREALLREAGRLLANGRDTPSRRR